MQVIVRTLTGKTVPIGPVQPTDTIEAVKDLVERSEGIPHASQRYIFVPGKAGDMNSKMAVSFDARKDGENNSRTLADCGIQDGSVLHLVPTLRS